jgi:hypothetical protein
MMSCQDAHQRAEALYIRLAGYEYNEAKKMIDAKLAETEDLIDGSSA